MHALVERRRSLESRFGNLQTAAASARAASTSTAGRAGKKQQQRSTQAPAMHTANTHLVSAPVSRVSVPTPLASRSPPRLGSHPLQPRTQWQPGILPYLQGPPLPAAASQRGSTSAARPWGTGRGAYAVAALSTWEEASSEAGGLEGAGAAGGGQADEAAGGVGAPAERSKPAESGSVQADAQLEDAGDLAYQ